MNVRGGGRGVYRVFVFLVFMGKFIKSQVVRHPMCDKFRTMSPAEAAAGYIAFCFACLLVGSTALYSQTWPHKCHELLSSTLQQDLPPKQRTLTLCVLD